MFFQAASYANKSVCQCPDYDSCPNNSLDTLRCYLLLLMLLLY